MHISNRAYFCQMYFKQSLLFFLFFFFISTGFAQTKTIVLVKDNIDQSPLSGIEIDDAKGNILGKTDVQGQAHITIQNFPVLLRKNGYYYQFAYTEKELGLVLLQPVARQLREVVINGKFSPGDYLLFLRDQNRPHFQQKDTTVYYHFSYRLSFPDNDWWEEAEGYIAFHYRGLEDYPADKPLQLSLFIQFDYKNKDNAFTNTKAFKKSKTYPPEAMLFGDLMSNYYRGWERLAHPQGAKINTTVDLRHDADGNQIFTVYGGKKTAQLLSTLSFDSSGALLSVQAYNQLLSTKVGPFHIVDNIWSKNAINSYCTTYKYTSGHNNRLLSSLTHSSTFYRKGARYYKMNFSATLSPDVPEKKCEIPLLYLNYNIYYSGEQGLGIKSLMDKGYDIQKDKFWKFIKK